MGNLHFVSVLPFLMLLLLIAIMPLINPRLWSNVFVQLAVSVTLSVPVIIMLATAGHVDLVYEHILFDYIPFIILLGSLFIISGGIYISSRVSGKPTTNLYFMITGSILASLIGTTGASMLLIRPLIRSNEGRRHQVHIYVFFIAIVANTGGLLTPLGDPALFIIYLKGIPFEWFLKLWPQWLFVNTLLLAMFYFFDNHYYKRQHSRPSSHSEYDGGIRLRIRGSLNFLWMVGVVAAVAMINEKNFPVLEEKPFLRFSREAVIILMATFSMVSSNKRNLQRNAFSWGPILEVAALFLGIFITMIPALLLLEENAAHIKMTSPTAFYFATGFLSSVLDNTPTAAVFHSLSRDLVSQGIIVPASLVKDTPEHLLRAISLGAVFFGSMTYIGNGPNFMVKSIAENHKIKMPGFFKYIISYSLIIFLPVFVIVYFVFV